MARCTRTRGLEVHHRRRDGGNGLDNAVVLCGPCHEGTTSFGTPGKPPPPFSEETKKRARARAGNQCECTSTRGCH
jgi:5-methylcytosine-specific restriction endonuclease McrA